LFLSIALPLGISFHTFQGISYTMDVHRGQIRAVRSFTDFALFVAFFPQLVAGPIVRAVEFLPQMVTPPRVRADQIADGFHFFVLGLFKKVFLADRLAEFVDAVFARPGAFDPSTLRWAVLAYAGQIYCDFSGYSDMAVGCAKWLGFELPQNFDFPYLAANVTDFWRRWHISLASWLRDYLFIPLGGSRKGRVRTHFNLILTLTLCGLWHGASWNYITWGFFNGVLLSLHRVYCGLLDGRPWLDRIRRNFAFHALGVATTFFLFLAGLIFVRTESRAGCWLMERALFGLAGAHGATHWVPGWVMLLIGVLALGHVFREGQYLPRRLVSWPPVLRAGAYLTAVVLLVTFGASQAKTFIYFQF
jgi:alginate O-acetyltransferase complex protein AlgI